MSLTEKERVLWGPSQRRRESAEKTSGVPDREGKSPLGSITEERVSRGDLWVPSQRRRESTETTSGVHHREEKSQQRRPLGSSQRRRESAEKTSGAHYRGESQ